nr:sodium-dependent multivitamin transporter-like isoform X2 [Cherax quadricarinatus]
MEKLGGVLQVVVMFSGIICGPLNGIFLAGILTPWVNAKGAMAGGLTAFVLSAWVVAGNYMYGSAPRYLPLSTSGCPVNLASLDNFTVISFSNFSATDSFINKTVTREYLQTNSTLSDFSTPTTVQGCTESQLPCPRSCESFLWTSSQVVVEYLQQFPHTHKQRCSQRRQRTPAR